MIFYHYTSVAMAERIFSSGINNGHLNHVDGRITKPIVWLTTDPRPDGHGLLTGREVLTAKDIAHMESVQGTLRNTITADKTQVRIQVKIEKSDRALVQFTHLASKEDPTGLWAKLMGLSCYRKVDGLFPDEIRREAARFKTKETTWWLYRGTVGPSSITQVDRCLAGSVTPYDFEQNGRQAFVHDGIVAPSNRVLAELDEVAMCVGLPMRYKYDFIRAFCCCGSETSNAEVIIRGRGIELCLDLTGNQITRSNSNEMTVAFTKWVVQNRTDLLDCWARAKERYFAFYPIKETSPETL